MLRLHVDEASFDEGLSPALVLASLVWVALVPLVVLGASQISLSALDFRAGRQAPAATAEPPWPRCPSRSRNPATWLP